MRLEHLLSGEAPLKRDLEALESLEDLESLDNLENLENLEKSDLRKRKEAAMPCAPVCLFCCHSLYSEKGDAEVASPSGRAARSLLPSRASPIAQLVRAPH